MSMNMEEMKEIERAEGEDTEEVRDEPEDIKRIAPWTKQITARGIVASIAIGILYSVIVMKLNLTTGLVPNLNVSAALLAFVFLRTWTKLLSKAGIVTIPFTRQENTIVQTCAVGGLRLWVACLGYITFSIISIIAIPLMFPELKWYYVVVAYILAGLTDMNMAYNYGKLAGKNNGVVAGLVGCGLIKSIVSISSDLMHAFKTGHLTLTSPRSMLLSQATGTVIGCVVAPFTFFLFYKAFDVGNPDGEYKAPYAIIYRNMAILGAEGFSALPQHCLQLCYGFFAFALLANLSRDLSPKGKYVPLPMAMAVPFIV